MEHKTSQYQRAVTPTIENSSSSAGLRGKILSYSTNSMRSRVAGVGITDQHSLLTSNIVNSNKLSNNTSQSNGLNDITVQGRATSSSVTAKIDFAALGPLPRFDLIPIYEEIPADGIMFAKIRNQPESLVIFRTQEERLRNPERLNLDRRQLEVCPLLEQEQRLRLLNYQNNRIKQISNLENLPNLIFLDLYNNQIVSLEGPLQTVKGLRVLMAGKNKIADIKNLNGLKKLDVLDLHSNEIKVIEGLDGLSELRVLNLAGNRISIVNNLQSLSSLTELNLRRNYIQQISGLNKLPSLQRVFLSHNSIQTFQEIQCIFEIQYLIELSMDGNPISEQDTAYYRNTLIANIQTLRHLDLKRVSDEERLSLSQNQPSANPISSNLGNQTIKSIKDIWNPSMQKASLNSTASHLNVQGEFQLSTSTNDNIGLECGDINSEIDVAPNTETNAGVEPYELKKQFLAGEIVQNDEQNPGCGIGNSNLVDQLSQQTSSVSISGLLAAIRSGKLPRNHPSLLDLEIINNDEKALIGIGDTWEWNAIPRRLLSSVSEAYFVFMKKDTLSAKLSSNLLHSSVMPTLKKLHVIGCELLVLKHLDSIVQYLVTNPLVQHLVIGDCQLSANLLRTYLIANIPNLSSFNNQSISVEERKSCENSLAPWISMKKKCLKAFTSVKLSLNPQTNNLNSHLTTFDVPSKGSLTLAETIKCSLSDNVDTYVPSMGNGSRETSKRNKFPPAPIVSTAQLGHQDELSKEFDIAVKDIINQVVNNFSSTFN